MSMRVVLWIVAVVIAVLYLGLMAEAGSKARDLLESCEHRGAR